MSLPFTASFFLGNRLLGTAKWDYFEHRGNCAAAQISIAYFCPKCGETWARILVSEHADRWSTRYRNCPKHTTGFAYGELGGHFYDSWSWNDTIEQDIPLEVLKYDFLFLMSLVDKYGSNET